MPLPLLLMGLWAWRAKLALILLLLWVGGAAAILLWPRGHVARAQVAPAETTAFAISSLLSAHPLALGQGLDTRPGGNFAVYLAALRSPDAARMLTTETALLQAMERNRQDSPLWSLRVSLGLSRALDADDVLAWMERHVAVTQNLGSITWTLELTHADPTLALQALISLHRFAEAKVRADLADQAARRVAALQARLQGESDVFLRNNLYDLLAVGLGEHALEQRGLAGAEEAGQDGGGDQGHVPGRAARNAAGLSDEGRRMSFKAPRVSSRAP